MPVPPRKPLRPAGPSKPGAPPRKLSMTLQPNATRPDPAAATESAAAPKRRPAARRRSVTRSSGSDGALERLMIRIGIGVVVLLLGGFGGRGLFSSSSPNQRYFNEFADLTHELKHGVALNPEQVRKRVAALPISGVTDPKLKEVHEVMLNLLSVPDDLNLENLQRVKTLGDRYDQLVDELNAKYAH